MLPHLKNAIIAKTQFIQYFKMPNDDKQDKIHLRKELGLFNGVAIIVGVIIGSGIFVSPRGVLMEVNSVGASLAIWTICGIISLIGALCYAELGTAIPKSGADYAYIKEAFGPLPAFLFIWVTLIIIVPCGNAITALTFANYVLQPMLSQCASSTLPTQLVAVLCIMLLTAISCSNVKAATRVQDIFTVTKVVALLIIIGTGFYMIAGGNTKNFESPFSQSTLRPGQIALSLYSGLFSYSGWNYLNFVTEELKNPYVNLPRAIWISMPLVTCVYVLTNVAYFSALSTAEIISSDAVAVTFAEKTIGQMSWIMPIFVAASCFGCLNGAIFASARLIFVGARDGLLPNYLALIHVEHVTPFPALMFGCVITICYMWIGDVYSLINYTSFVESIFVSMSVSGLLYLRWKKPNLHRPIKVSLLFPIGFLVICAFLILFPLFYNAKECFIGAAITLSGIPVYWVGVAWKKKPDIIYEYNNKIMDISQKLFVGVIAEEDSESQDEKPVVHMNACGT